MDIVQPSLEEKLAFFGQFDWHAADNDDELDDREVQNRRLCRSFFHKESATATSKKPVGVLECGQSSLSSAHRRVSSAPSPAAQVIRGTPAGARVRNGPLRNLLDTDASVIKETPATDSVGGRQALLRRSESTPVHPTKRLLSSTNEASPSVTIGMKKRKRDPAIKLKPDAEQIFRGLSFFYIPNNDIAPARRLRINKAREYGAEWTRHEQTATHIVVDRTLEYKDVIDTVLRSSKRQPPKVVNEEYPIDCIRFKALLDHRQQKYQIKGLPSTPDESIVATPASSAEESIKSLQLKPRHKDRSRWDYVPSRSGQSTPLVEQQLDSEAIVLDLGQTLDSAQDDVTGYNDEVHNNQLDHVKTNQEDGPQSTNEPVQDAEAIIPDELSEYILLVQKYKDLPLDVDEEDIDYSHAKSVRPRRDSDGDHSVESTERTRRSMRKALTFEDKFACNQAGAKDAASGNPNARTIEVLQSMADYYDRISDHWRTTGYRKAIHTLKNQSTKISTEEQAFKLPNIGRRLAQKIEEIVTTNKLRRLEYAETEPTDVSLQLFLGIYGVGVSQAQQWIAQGFRTLGDLKLGAKLSRNQMIGVEKYEDLNTRIPRREVEALGAVVMKAAAEMDPNVKMIIGGSYRRGSDSSNDIDFIVTKPDTESTTELRQFLDGLVTRLEMDGFLVARLASSRSIADGSKWHGCCLLPRIKGFNDSDSYRPVWRRIDFLLVPATEMGAALIYFTGNDIFNRSLRLLAAKKSMRLNQRGLYRDVGPWPRNHKMSEEDLIEGRDEKRIFEILGVRWREPHERWC